MTKKISRILVFLLAGALVPVEGGARDFSASEAKSFFNTNGCNACHGIEEVRLGPAYRDVALFYDDRSEETVEALAMKIRYGGAGKWGYVPMISHPDISWPEIKAAARWILGLSDEEESGSP